ncbi:MAG: molecular chaperone [Hyphomicrobiaceae bacterium]
MRYLTSVACLAVAGLLAMAAPAWAFQIAVSPLRFEIDLNGRPVAKALQVFNQGHEPIQVSVSVAHFDLDENNKVREIAPTAHSLDQWIVVRPLSFTIPPGASQTVRFAVRPYVRPKPGEYRAMIFLEQKGSQAVARRINVRFRFGVAVYAYVGSPERTSKLHGVATGPNGLTLDVESLGNAHVRLEGNVGIWPAASFPGEAKAKALVVAKQSAKQTKTVLPPGAVFAAPLPNLPILPGTRRKVATALPQPLKPGAYRAVIVGSLSGKPISRLLSFDVRDAGKK